MHLINFPVNMSSQKLQNTWIIKTWCCSSSNEYCNMHTIMCTYVHIYTCMYVHAHYSSRNKAFTHSESSWNSSVPLLKNTQAFTFYPKIQKNIPSVHFIICEISTLKAFKTNMYPVLFSLKNLKNINCELFFYM